MYRHSDYEYPSTYTGHYNFSRSLVHEFYTGLTRRPFVDCDRGKVESCLSPSPRKHQQYHNQRSDTASADIYLKYNQSQRLPYPTQLFTALWPADRRVHQGSTAHSRRSRLSSAFCPWERPDICNDSVFRSRYNKSVHLCQQVPGSRRSTYASNRNSQNLGTYANNL